MLRRGRNLVDEIKTHLQPTGRAAVAHRHAVLVRCVQAVGEEGTEAVSGDPGAIEPRCRLVEEAVASAVAGDLDRDRQGE